MLLSLGIFFLPGRPRHQVTCVDREMGGRIRGVKLHPPRRPGQTNFIHNPSPAPELRPMEFCPPDRRAPRHLVEIEGWRYEYAVFENEIEIEDGRRTVVALHGFARCVEDWAVVAEAWPEPVRIVAVHLPHH